MTVHFCSDLHLGHRFVASLRGFGDSRETADVQAHDDTLAERWDSVVRKDDLVWVLGDVSVSSPVSALAWIAARPGRKRLVTGNHDPVHPMHSKAPRYFRDYLSVFEYVSPFARTKIMGQEVLLSHFPYAGPGGDRPEYSEGRYTQYRLPNEGKWLLHGHTHGKERLHDGKQLHVGVDAWDLTPVPDSTIFRLMQESECACGESDVYDGWAQCSAHPDN